MLLLTLLILFGTITMVNLFIAVIISDISKMRDDVYIQNLINMAQYSILVEAFLPSCILDKMRIDDKVQICIHSLCIRGCPGKTKLPRNFDPIKKRLESILDGNSTTREAKGCNKDRRSTTTASIMVQHIRV